MQYAPHLPTVHIDLGRIRKNFSTVSRITSPQGSALPTVTLPEFGGTSGRSFAWPSQLAVVKSDAYGHGQIQVGNALLDEGATLFASGSVQECLALREGIKAHEGPQPPIIALLGLVSREDVFLCAENGIIPVVHSFEQFDMIAGTGKTLAIAVKCNTGMSRLGFNEKELPDLIAHLKKTPGAVPVIAMSHMHSADAEDGRAQVATHGKVFARFLAALRAEWPDVVASLGNSAGTLLADDLAAAIGGPHVCRPGVALYGSNPFNGTSLAPLGEGLVPTMCVSTPILAVRTLAGGDGYGYGQTYKAQNEHPAAIIAAGYADCFARSFSNKGVVCIEGFRAPVIGRVSMQMTAVDISAVAAGGGSSRPATAWLMGGPHANAVSCEELARLWGTITYEVMCLLGYNMREYGEYPEE